MMSASLQDYLGYPLSVVLEKLKELDSVPFRIIETSAPSFLQKPGTQESFARSEAGEKVGLSEKRVVRIDADERVLTVSRFLTAMPGLRKEESND